MADQLVARLDPDSFAEVARHVLDTPTYEWIRSGAGEGSASDNESAFGRHRLRPNVLVDVSEVRVGTTVLGAAIVAPIMVAPLGLQRAAHPDGELAMADGVARAGSLLVMAVNATVSLEDVAAAQPRLPWWLQLYNWDDRGALAELIARAEAAGCLAIVPLVNTAIAVSHVPPRIGFRPLVEPKHGFGNAPPGLSARNTWEYLTWLRSRTSLPIVPKGIMTGADAVRALDSGASAIMISNHGGRQLPRSIATLDALPDVAAMVDGRAEIYLDGGVRSGADVLVALALGARAVLVGRPAMWGLAVGGADGVERVLRSLARELAADAALSGVKDVNSVPIDLVVR